MRAPHEPAVMIETLARAGFLVKGALYIIVGWLAFQLGMGMGGRVTDSEGALSTILRQPFGRGLLLAAAVGLFGYAAWRMLQGVLDTDRLGSGLKGIALRSSFVLRGAIHALLGWQALRLYRGLASSNRGNGQVLTEILGWPFGDAVLVLAGLGIFAFAVYELYSAATGRLPRDLGVGRLRRDAGPWAMVISRFGIGARAAVLGVIAWLVVQTATTGRGLEEGGTAESLRTLAAQPRPFGRWLLLAVSLGLVAYGVYQIIHARYLHIRSV